MTRLDIAWNVLSNFVRFAAGFVSPLTWALGFQPVLTLMLSCLLLTTALREWRRAVRT